MYVIGALLWYFPHKNWNMSPFKIRYFVRKIRYFVEILKISMLMPVLQYFNLGRVLILFHAHSNLNMISKHLVASSINFWTFGFFSKIDPPNVSISLRAQKWRSVVKCTIFLPNCWFALLVPGPLYFFQRKLFTWSWGTPEHIAPISNPLPPLAQAPEALNSLRIP